MFYSHLLSCLYIPHNRISCVYFPNPEVITSLFVLILCFLCLVALLHILESLNKMLCSLYNTTLSRVQKMHAVWCHLHKVQNPEMRKLTLCPIEYHPTQKQRWLFLGFLTLNFPKGKRLYEIIFKDLLITHATACPPTFQWKPHFRQSQGYRLLGSVVGITSFPKRWMLSNVPYSLILYSGHQVIWDAQCIGGDYANSF